MPDLLIVWRADSQDWAVREDEVDIARFPSLYAAEQWVIAESLRREAAS